jgi:pimeloyl-ACP methyl ester carboxylesterase
MEQPQWLDKAEFPFASRWFTSSSGTVHYVDEGTGPVIVMVHGTPEWSFTYRDIIKSLRGNYRCIAMDFLGYGLSAKPQDGNYTVPAHSARLAELIAHLQLKDIVFIAGDFGGAMAIDYAIHHSANVRALVLWNTWCRDLRQDKHFAKAIKVVQTGFAKFLYRRLNFPVGFIMPRAYGDRKKLTKKIHAHYKSPLDSYANRIATYEIAKELNNASPWWQQRWDQMDKIQSIPKLVTWGMKDTFIPHSELEQWKNKIPEAQFMLMNEAGHWPYEEQPEVFLKRFVEFMHRMSPA